MSPDPFPSPPPQTSSSLSSCLGSGMPQHVAIIMDGNRRWAKQRGLPSMAGHWQGAQQLVEIVRAAGECGISILTAYAFSTENWSRSDEETDILMSILETYLLDKREWMIEEGVRLEAIGDLSLLPASVQKTLYETRTATQAGTRLTLVLALNYGARDEIRRAIGRILERHDRAKISSQELTEPFIAQYLDTCQWKDPDFLIRTSGEQRLSNFMLWQLSYTELYITDILWPDFTKEHFMEALCAFQLRERRKGGDGA